MPRERQEFFRRSKVSEKEKIFVLAFEGNKTEDQYFREFKDSEKFNDDLIYLHLLIRNENDTNSAPYHVFKHLKKEAKDKYNFDKSDELWMIIDTDRWRNIPQIAEACSKTENMFIAVSNPCFEFWLLLHIKEIVEYSDKELDNLLKNKKVSSKKRYIDKEITNILGSYNKSNIKANRFIPNIERAIIQAENLDTDMADFPIGLGSYVYKLVRKLIV